MRIFVAKLTNRITDAQFAAALHSVQRQVDQDFTPLWSMTAIVRMTRAPARKKPNPELNTAEFVLYVGDPSIDPETSKDADGYHAANHAGIPYGFVFVDPSPKAAEPWTVTLSHEILESIADPDANLAVVAPHPRLPRRRVLLDYEVCDPVQGDTYLIDGLPVSNFVLPAYFADADRKVPTRNDYLNKGVERFGIRPGGYISFVDLDTWRRSNVWGKEAKARVETKRAVYGAHFVKRRADRHASTELLPSKD
jgi:hypothetical protein